MAISVQLRIEDHEVEDLLAFMQIRFPGAWHGEKASIMERAIKVLRIADEYEKAKDPFSLAALQITSAEDVSPTRELPSCKHP